MSNLKKFFSIIILLLIVSCADNLQELSRKENKLKLEDFYSSFLALEYLEYSRSLSATHNWRDSQYFAKKGLDTAKGYSLVLESPQYWGANNLELEDLISAQKRYEIVATNEVKHILPIQMAHLTFLYDCWVSKESKPAFRIGEMSKCKDRFYKLLEEVEYFVENLKKDREPKSDIITPEFSRYLLAFDFDKSNFNDKANKKLIDILNAIDDLDGDYMLLLVGNADRVGKNLYNENLSLKRIRAVEKYLVANGVPSQIIEIRSMGEDFPDIITKDARRQQFNRTVAVYLVKGAKSVANMPLPVIRNIVYKQDVEEARKERGFK